MSRPRGPAFLGLHQFAFFAAAGIYVPFHGLYTRSLGFTSLQIGFLAALTPISKILGFLRSGAASPTGAEAEKA